MDLDQPGTLFWRGDGPVAGHDFGQHEFHNIREAAAFAMVTLPSRYRNEWLCFETAEHKLWIQALAEVFSTGDLVVNR